MESVRHLVSQLARHPAQLEIRAARTQNNLQVRNVIGISSGGSPLLIVGYRKTVLLPESRMTRTEGGKGWFISTEITD